MFINTQMYTWMLCLQLRQKKKKGVGGGLCCLILSSPIKIRGEFWVLPDELLGGTGKALPVHTNTSAEGTQRLSLAPTGCAVTGPSSALWSRSPLLPLAHRESSRQRRGQSRICHLLPAFPPISVANNILFLYTLTLKQLGVTQAKIIFKS